MKQNFLTNAELIEKLKQLPPDGIPVIAHFGLGHSYTFKDENFFLDEYDGSVTYSQISNELKSKL